MRGFEIKIAVWFCRVDKRSASTNVGWVDALRLSTLQVSSLFLTAENDMGAEPVILQE